MTNGTGAKTDPGRILDLLDLRKGRIGECLEACASCSICAESCFLYKEKDNDPQYMPSYKVINTLGRLYKRRGRVSRVELEQMQQLLWRNCVLCGRCYCPLGIDIPNMIAFARGILRSQGIYGVFPHTSGAPEAEYCEADAACDRNIQNPGDAPGDNTSTTTTGV